MGFEPTGNLARRQNDSKGLLRRLGVEGYEDSRKCERMPPSPEF